MKQKIKFVIDKKLDIQNHLIGVDTYRRKLHSYTQDKNERYEKLLKLSESGRKKFISNEINDYYSPGKRRFLINLIKDSNTVWAKIEKEVLRRLEKIHENPFPYKSVKGVLSTASRFGYNTQKNPWFAAPMFKNKYSIAGTAMHELMHFMFIPYYWEYCTGKGLSKKQIWDIKEAFTVLLNLEFEDLRLEKDNGYPEHAQLRKIIEKEWLKTRNFRKTLDKAIKISF